MLSEGVLQNSRRSQPSPLFACSLLAALSVAAVAQNAWYWMLLPDRVATHFDIQGNPDSWMNKTSATVVMLAVQVGLPWLLVGVAQLTRYLPAALINIPRREYWLHTDRRAASLTYIRYWISWVSITASLFMMAISHLTYLANIRGLPLNVHAFTTLLVLYLVGILLLVAALLRRFRTIR